MSDYSTGGFNFFQVEKLLAVVFYSPKGVFWAEKAI